MISFENIKDYSSDFPKTWSFLWSPEEASRIPEEHKDQIFFLNKEAKQFLNNYIQSSKMVTGAVCDPFNKRYFKKVDEFHIVENCSNEIKKWLYNKSIPFDKFVFIDSERSGQAVALTWKMVIKYWDGLFFSDDLLIFDETLNWGLFYFHEDFLYFGSEKNYDKEYEVEKTRELNALIAKLSSK